MATILVIDDDDDVRFVISETLKMVGHQVLNASEGGHGIEMFFHEHPDLVITDLMMPGKDGVETIIDIHRAQPHAKIIAVSGGGGSSTDLIEMALRLGARSVLRKPFRANDLIEQVQHCLSAA